MPELPEVETIRRQLLPIYKNEILEKIDFRYAGLLKNATPDDVRTALEGKPLQDIDRFGKFLLFRFPEHHLVVHLGMSGVFIKDVAQSRYPQHIHVVFHFSANKHLYYQDFRKFGKMWLYGSRVDFSQYGVDPFSPEFTLKKLRELLHLTRRNIKVFLMDQHQIAGIGNIYANEILFEARISPFKRTDELTPEQETALFRSIRAVLERAIQRFGTTYSAYRTVEGESGENQHFLKVYHRAEQPCVRCGTPIEKTTLGSRSTFYCPTCQV